MAVDDHAIFRRAARDLISATPGFEQVGEAASGAQRVTDAEVVTLCVAQAIMGIPCDRRFLAVAAKRLGHLFPRLPQQPGYFKRRRRLAATLEWLMGVFANHSEDAKHLLVERVAFG
jgi:hypothetical protein